MFFHTKRMEIGLQLLQFADMLLFQKIVQHIAKFAFIRKEATLEQKSIYR